MRLIRIGKARLSGRRFGTSHVVRLMVAVSVGTLLALGPGASGARPASSDQVTISLLAVGSNQPAFDVLIPDFERHYPDITVVPTYAGSSDILYQLEPTELAAGNAPDVLQTTPGCGTPNAVCELGKAGDLAPMIAVPWAKRSPRLLTSLEKYRAGLVAFTPNVSPFGVFTNDGLFARLGLKVPETFKELLVVCKKAKADGTVAVRMDGGNQLGMANLTYALAATTVYRTHPHWNSALDAGGVTFDGTPGWRQALQRIVDMQDAGCFSPGVVGENAEVAFAQGQGLMFAGTSGLKGRLDADGPQFGYSFHVFPAGSSPAETEAMIALPNSFSVNAHSSAAVQAAAQTFINFLAGTKQDAEFAQLKGGLTADELVNADLPRFMSSVSPRIAAGDYVLQPSAGWWNASVDLAVGQDAVGLLTGQSTVDGILKAMDAAYEQGPA
jgi:raffinose/stachyose/melibiose transport system substrate-binding protein